jgi:uncharacterized protein YijF (DUF1287 family)
MLARIVCSLVVTVAAAGCARPSPAPLVVTTDLSPAVRRLVDSAIEQTSVTTSYDASYVKLAYPNGDVPAHTGACTDVLIRAFRANGVDLQRDVHEDMRRAFSVYPKRWGLSRPDTNIDHRRVPNLMVYFERTKRSVGVSDAPGNYLPGDVVAWDLGGGVTHIGLVSDRREAESARYLVVHNIGAGTKLEDVLFAWKVIGHYRCFR